MYLSARISCLCLWKDSIWKSDITETNSAVTAGDGGKPAVKERETQGF